MVFVFLLYFIISLLYYVVNVLNFFCVFCDFIKVFILIGLRCFLYSSFVLILMVVILLVFDLRVKVQWCCFRFYVINEEFYNDLYVMEILGIKLINNLCIFVNIILKKDEFV